MYNLNQIKKKLKEIATDHKQINSFGFGDIWEYSAETQEHPCMWVELTGASIAGRELRINFSIYQMDLVHKDETNELDVLSDRLQVSQDVIALLQDDDNATNFYLTEDISLTNFTEKTDDEVSGWKADVSFRVHNSGNICNIPTT